MVNGKEIRVFDNDFDNHIDKDSKSASYRNQNPIQIAFTDLVGQPTWVQFGTVSIPCVMRSDIQVGIIFGCLKIAADDTSLLLFPIPR